MRLIDSDALVHELEVWYCDQCDRNPDCVHGRDCPIYDETTHIYEADTVEAVPLKPVAKWLAGYAMPPGGLKAHKAIGKPEANYFKLRAEAWADFLRDMDWEEKQ